MSERETYQRRLRVISRIPQPGILVDELHECAVVVKGRAFGKNLVRRDILEKIHALAPSLSAFREHKLWRNGYWTCRVGGESPYSTGELPSHLHFHTDMTRYRHPPAIAVIHCVQPDPGGGGANRLLHISDALRRLHESRRDDILDVLHRPRVLNLTEGQKPLVALAPRDDNRGVVRIFDRAASASHGVHLELNESEGKALEEFVQLAESWTDICTRVILQTGDVLMFSNHRFLHAREACGGPGRVTEILLGGPATVAATSG